MSLPLVRAASRIHNDLTLLHFDSHTDSYEVDPVHQYDAATQFAHAALEQRVRVTGSYHIGLRGSTPRQGVYARTKELGYSIITMRNFMERGHDDVLAELQETLENRPIYLSWDMDVFDPSCAPGVCTPAWGGFLAREGLEIVRDLAGLNIVAADNRSQATLYRRRTLAPLRVRLLLLRVSPAPAGAPAEPLPS